MMISAQVAYIAVVAIAAGATWMLLSALREFMDWYTDGVWWMKRETAHLNTEVEFLQAEVARREAARRAALPLPRHRRREKPIGLPGRITSFGPDAET